MEIPTTNDDLEGTAPLSSQTPRAISLARLFREGWVGYVFRCSAILFIVSVWRARCGNSSVRGQVDEKRPTRAVAELREIVATRTERRLLAHVIRTAARQKQRALAKWIALYLRPISRRVFHESSPQLATSLSRGTLPALNIGELRQRHFYKVRCFSGVIHESA